jgi:succinate dehydrogenase/fumarate reductase cytochrome b subunit
MVLGTHQLNGVTMTAEDAGGAVRRGAKRLLVWLVALTVAAVTGWVVLAGQPG